MSRFGDLRRVAYATVAVAGLVLALALPTAMASAAAVPTAQAHLLAVGGNNNGGNNNNNNNNNNGNNGNNNNGGNNNGGDNGGHGTSYPGPEAPYAILFPVILGGAALLVYRRQRARA